MQIQIDNKVNEIVAMFDQKFHRQARFSASQALNRTAFIIAKEEMPEQTESTFDRGSTRWTKGAFEYKKSTKNRLVAVVATRERNAYMALQIFGGHSQPKPGRALAMKTDRTRLTRQGNISRKQRASLLKKANTRKDWFVGKPKGSSQPYGVYQRVMVNRRRKIVAHMYYDREGFKYDKRFDFHKIGQYKAEQIFGDLFFQAMYRNMLSERLDAHLVLSR